MLVIFSKLAISEPDRHWIEAIRRRHDPQHQLVEAHFTFVFPFSGMSADELLAHARPIAAATAPIRFGLSKAAAVKDPLGPVTHLFLLPTKGTDQMLALHARLYDGVLAAYRHPTLPFAPHVTVGAFEDPHDAAGVAASLKAFDIPGRLDGLQVAAFDGHSVVELEALPFGAEDR